MAKLRGPLFDEEAMARLIEEHTMLVAYCAGMCMPVEVAEYMFSGRLPAALATIARA